MAKRRIIIEVNVDEDSGNEFGVRLQFEPEIVGKKTSDYMKMSDEEKSANDAAAYIANIITDALS